MNVLSGASPTEEPLHIDAPPCLEADLWTELRSESAATARERLFLHFLPYAHALAAQLFAGRQRDDVEFHDFCQCAHVGLLEAIDRFEPDRGVPFKAFAALRIKGAVISGVEKLTDAQEQLSLQRRIRRERLASLKASQTADGRAAEAFAALGEVAAGLAIGFMLDDTSLILGEPNKPSPYSDAYQSIAWSQTKGRLGEAIRQLPERTQKIIHYHYFLGLPFEQIGHLLGLTKGRISQLHRAALTELRHLLSQDRHILAIG